MRKLAASSLQNNKSSIIKDEIDLMIEKLDGNFINRSISINILPLPEGLVSCLWRLITHDVLEENDLKELTKNIFDFAQEFLSPLVQIVQHQKALFLLTENLGLTNQDDNHRQIKRKIKQFIEGSKGQSETSPLVKVLLQHEKNPYHHEENLLWTCSDLLLVGAYTLWVHLQWALVCLIRNPRWKTLLRQESGQESKPLTDAFISEVLRTFVVESKGLSYPMVAVDDVQVGDHFIPKDTIILHMLNEVMGDPKHFPDPRDFDPYRFVTYQNHDGSNSRFVPFGVGKRKCIGESIAKEILTCFLSQLLDKYDILAKEEIKISFNDAAIAKPTPFNVIIKPIQ